MEGGIFVWIQYEGRWSVELVNDRGAQVKQWEPCRCRNWNWEVVTYALKKSPSLKKFNDTEKVDQDTKNITNAFWNLLTHFLLYNYGCYTYTNWQWTFVFLQVSDFTWSHDGTQALIAYRDGFVLVGSVSGQRHWSSEINLESQITCGIWTPDDQQVHISGLN